MGKIGPGSDGNEGILRILQSSSFTETLPSDCLVLYPGHALGGGAYPTASADWASGGEAVVYSTTPADWVTGTHIGGGGGGRLTLLQRSSRCIQLSHPTGQVGWTYSAAEKQSYILQLTGPSGHALRGGGWMLTLLQRRSRCIQ